MKPVMFDGIEFPSTSAAARYAGISYWKMRDILDLPATYAHDHVTIRGVTYPTQAEAAKALGVSRQCVSAARANNTLDRVGLRKARQE